MNKSPLDKIKSGEFIRCLGQFFKRDLISIPLIKKYPLQTITQRCNLKASTLELDTASYPNIEYVAGARLSVYPPNPNEHVNSILKHLTDDLGPTASSSGGQKSAISNASGPQTKRAKLDDNWTKLTQICGRDSLRLALVFLYEITTAPSRGLIQIMAENCISKEHRFKLASISKSDESWEKWVCQAQRTLKSTFEEFSSCHLLASVLISELNLQQPRQYSISSIKSSKRFRSEIIVFQHKFTPKQIKNNLENIKERDQILRATSPMALSPTDPNERTRSDVKRAPPSLRSVRSVANFSASPISTHQVSRVPSFSGPLMNIYATSLSTMGATTSTTGGKNKSNSKSNVSGTPSSTLSGIGSRMSSIKRKGTRSSLDVKSGHEMNSSASLLSQAGVPDSASQADKSSTSKHMYDGLCSNYLLNLSPNERIVCEFVENPRFTLKGNRERPIMMIGQDVGVVAFRPFWQQRNLEHDRAEIFYKMFKDLSPKKFGDMQLVCLTGNRCKVEDLFEKEINQALGQKILSSVVYINRSHFVSLLDATMKGSQNNPKLLNALQIDSKELIDLGNRIYKLLIENNGCLYTCCDPQMTQAIEILTVESIVRNNTTLTKERVMALLPHWKGRGRSSGHKSSGADNSDGNGNKYLYTLENQFERAQIVQEIYDASI